MHSATCASRAAAVAAVRHAAGQTVAAVDDDGDVTIATLRRLRPSSGVDAAAAVGFVAAAGDDVTVVM